MKLCTFYNTLHLGTDTTSTAIIEIGTEKPFCRTSIRYASALSQSSPTSHEKHNPLNRNAHPSRKLIPIYMQHSCEALCTYSCRIVSYTIAIFFFRSSNCVVYHFHCTAEVVLVFFC